MLFSHLLPILTLTLLITHIPRPTVGDTFSRITCWCRSPNSIGFFNDYKYHNTFLSRTFAIQEKCVDYVSHGECQAAHVRQSMICQDYPGEPPAEAKMNTFCYNHRGHEMFVKKDAADVVRFNGHKRNIEQRLVTTNATKEAVDEACSQICFGKFGIPIMLPWDPGHGVVESHAEEWAGFWNLEVCDGCKDFEDGVTGLGKGILNDKGGVDHDLTGHYSPKGYYDTTGYNAKDLLDRLPNKD